VGARPSACPRPHSLEPPPEGGGDGGCYRHRAEACEPFEFEFELLEEFELELFGELELELFDEFEFELLEELELELLDELELELLDELELELLEVFELELLDELKLELLDEFELELLDELELELLEEFELELPADASCVVRAASTARTTASGGELPTVPSEAAAVATSPHAPSPAAYVFQCLGTFLRLSMIGPRFRWVAVRFSLLPGHGESSVSRP
jgi:hypothetical protein